jgi:hypothetical protein
MRIHKLLASLIQLNKVYECMPKKSPIKISDELRKKVTDIASHYNLNSEQAINNILSAVSNNKANLIQIGEKSNPNDLFSVLHQILENYVDISHFFNDVLKEVGAEGKFQVNLADVEINLVRDYFRFSFDALTNDYDIISIEVRKENGCFNFSTHTSIELNQTKNNSFDDLELVAQSFDKTFDECHIYLDKSVTENRELIVDCWSSKLKSLPDIKQIDKVIKRMLRKAKIQRKNTRTRKVAAPSLIKVK